MFAALTTSYLVIMAALIVCITIFNRGNVNYRKSIVRMLSVAVFAVASYVGFILIPEGYPHLAEFMSGVYRASTDWLVIALILFMADFTHIHPPTNWLKNMSIVLASVDSISLLVNPATHHLFSVERLSLDWIEYWHVLYTPFHSIHLALVYVGVLYCIGILLYRFAVEARIYKGKYGTVLLLLAAIILMNLICVTRSTIFDYSVLFYGFLAMSVCYFVVYASPKNLRQSMNTNLAKTSAIGLFVYDDAKSCVGANQTARDLFGQQGDDEIYALAEKYLQDWEEEYRDSMANVMGAERQIEKDGETVYLYVNYQRLLDEVGRVFGYGFQFEDRTDMVRRYEQEKYRATHDPLTGLLSRDAFEVRVKEILAKSAEPYYMVCSDIKDFKLINELCGTEAGDSLLLAMSGLIRRWEQGESVSTRMYADKFCTFTPARYFDEEKAKTNILQVMDSVLPISFKTHFYIGIYEVSDKDESVWTMCDKAMMAIDTIRGTYEKYFSYYSEEMFQRILKEKDVLGLFDAAIENGEFHMFLQPQIANDGKLVGAEALVRWIHPGKGMIYPGDFIPVLEKTGLIHKLDLYMWEQAAQKLQQWKREGRGNLSISVNISTKDFYLIDLNEAFRSLSERYDFDIKNLKLEITESALMKDVKKIMQSMDELHAQGFDIEIDDFGSGYSSLGMLKDINADILKLDMIFLHETENVDRSTTILKNVISMSKELGMPVITEGVETREQVEFLQSTGCDMFQGYYFAKPMSVDSFEREYPA